LAELASAGAAAQSAAGLNWCRGKPISEDGGNPGFIDIAMYWL
jgi:hypothetical protein